MRKEIRERLERNQEMADGITLSKEQFQQLLDAFNTPKMNPLEQKKFEEEQKREKHRELAKIEHAKAEAISRWNKQNGCTHSRDGRTGNATNRGQGEWTTGGQVHGNDTASLSCLRCGTVWTWQTTPQEREYISNAGLLGFPPPAIDRCLNKEDFAKPVFPSQEKIESLTA